MPAFLAALLGALGLSILTTLYHVWLFPDLIGAGQYERIWFLHTIPTGVLLGLGSAIALRTKPGLAKLFKCVAAAVLGLVPFGIWVYIYSYADPIHALPIFVQAVTFFVPSLLWVLFLVTTGLFQLRPARFRSSH